MLKDVIDDLSNWMEKEEFKGWDPYDIKGLGFYLKLKSRRKILDKVLIRLIEFIESFFPLFLRRVFQIKKTTNNKSLGLILSSYSLLAKIDKNYFNKIENLYTLLMKNQSEGFQGISWGYPFDWQSKKFIPKNTPSSVVTSTVGEGMYNAYKATNDTKYLQVCIEICEFFINSLNIKEIDSSTICFSYTPVDDFMVHNANLFVAEFLIKIGKETENNSYIELGLKAANYAIVEQKDEGFLPYWGMEQTQKYSGGVERTDHYHSGFEIRMLYSIYKLTEKPQYKEAYTKYFKWFLENMYTSNGLIKNSPNNIYPINIHSTAESILLLSILKKEGIVSEEKINQVFDWNEKNMKLDKGQYIYLIKNISFIGEVKIKISMIRWGQSWILRAYTQMLLSQRNDI